MPSPDHLSTNCLSSKARGEGHDTFFIPCWIRFGLSCAPHPDHMDHASNVELANPTPGISSKIVSTTHHLDSFKKKAVPKVPLAETHPQTQHD